MQIEFLVAENSDRPAEAESAGYTVHQGPAQDPWEQSLRALSRAPADILWIDFAGLEREQGAGLTALRRFRVARPQTRILVDIPEDLEAPNAVMAEIVGLGVLDIVPEALPLEEALARHPTYADVARWQGGALSWDSASPENPPPRSLQQQPPERQVVLVASPARPLVILVLGTHLGAGVTTTAVAVANTLSDAGHAVVLMEALDTGAYTRYPERIAATVDNPQSESNEPPADRIKRLIGLRQWSYIIVDGNPTLWGLASSVDMVVVVGPGAWHRAWRWESVAKRVQEARLRHSGLLITAVLHADQGVTQTVEWLSQVLWAEAETASMNGGIFIQSEAVWPKLLAPVLPATSLQRRGWWWRQWHTPVKRLRQTWPLTTIPPRPPRLVQKPQPIRQIERRAGQSRVIRRWVGRSLNLLWAGLFFGGLCWAVSLGVTHHGLPADKLTMWAIHIAQWEAHIVRGLF